MRYAGEVAAAVSHWGRELGVKIDPALVHAILQRETLHGTHPLYLKGRGKVLEPDGDYSYGPMMVKGSTARAWKLDPRDLVNPSRGIFYGVRVLAEDLKRFAGDQLRAIAAYNAGPRSARRGHPGSFSNQPYVDAVTSFWKRYRGQVGAVGSMLVPLAIAAAVALLLMRQRRRG